MITYSSNKNRTALKYLWICCAFCALGFVFFNVRHVSAQPTPHDIKAPAHPLVPNPPRSCPATPQNSPDKPRDGQHDFDFEIGAWKIHLSRLADRLAGSTSWVEFDGTSVTRKVWDGRANLEEFETDSPNFHIEGLTLRVYNPQTHQWSIYWANSKDPDLGQPLTPMVGEFKNGRGEFYDQETWKGRYVFVRFIWSAITPDSAHFEQSYSNDGGKTWEVNWKTDQTRVAGSHDDEPNKSR